MALPRLYIIGDSISVQYRPYLKTFVEGFFNYTRGGSEAEALKNLDLPAGANSGDSSAVLIYLTAAHKARALPADILLLNCGLHDIKTTIATGAKQVPIDRYRENLAAIARLVREMRVKLVWARTTPADETVHNTPRIEFHRFAADVDAYNAVADEVMRGAGVPILDLYTFTKTLGPDLYCDHVHFHEPIREKQAAFLAGGLAALEGEIRNAK